MSKPNDLVLGTLDLLLLKILALQPLHGWAIGLRLRSLSNDVLQVNPNCDAKILEAAYHYLAKLYHPDHAATADTAKFHQVTEAYRILRDPQRRAEYDHLHAKNCNGESYKFPSSEEFEIEEESAA